MRLSYIDELQELEFHFVDEYGNNLLNGENYYKLWFQGKLRYGEAKFYVDDVLQFTMGTTEVTIGPAIELYLDDPRYIKIMLENANIDIDFLYLEQI